VLSTDKFGRCPQITKAKKIRFKMSENNIVATHALPDALNIGQSPMKVNKNIYRS